MDTNQESTMPEAAPPALPRRRKKPPARVQLTPQDWVAAASALLRNNGVDAVRVDVLAKQMGVTRGSFYWHFADREYLLQRMVTAWRDAATEQGISRLEQQGAQP